MTTIWSFGILLKFHIREPTYWYIHPICSQLDLGWHTMPTKKLGADSMRVVWQNLDQAKACDYYLVGDRKCYWLLHVHQLKVEPSSMIFLVPKSYFSACIILSVIYAQSIDLLDWKVPPIQQIYLTLCWSHEKMWLWARKTICWGTA